MGFALQLAEEGVLLGEQDLDVLHADRDHPGADVWVQRVDALGEKEEGRMMDVVNADRSTRLKITRGVSLEDWCAYLGSNQDQHLNQTHGSDPSISQRLFCCHVGSRLSVEYPLSF